MRNRTEECPYCHKRRGITVNLETEQVWEIDLPIDCLYGWKCIEEIREKALLAPFADGKVRRR